MPALNSSQVMILKTLAKVPHGLTKEQLEKKAKVPVTSGSIGPVFKDVLKNYPNSLYALGMVRVAKMEGEAPRWSITSKGLDAAEEYKTRLRPDDAVNVPPAVLDPVVKAFMATRTYGLETYSDEDLAEIREQLGEDYLGANLEDLRQQIVNRRKQGAFTSDAQRRKRKLEQFERVLKEYDLHLTSESSSKLSRLLMEYSG